MKCPISFFMFWCSSSSALAIKMQIPFLICIVTARRRFKGKVLKRF
jgi:hypothetical protein